MLSSKPATFGEIYPTCPNCDNHASDGNGIRFADLPNFTWVCPNCELVHEGTFRPHYTDVQWSESRPRNTRDSLVQKLRTFISR